MASNLPSPLRGLWRDYSQPVYQGWSLTVSSTQSLAILAILGAIIAYTQSRWWIVTRYLLISILQPIQLPDSEPLSLQNLSQSKAITLLVSKAARRHQKNRSMTSVSPWFGVISLLNVLAFLVIAALAPYFLTGASTTAQVRLKPATTCDGLQPPSEETLNQALNLYIYCHPNASATCEYKTRTVESDLPLDLNPSARCPFGESCVIRPYYSWGRILREELGLPPDRTAWCENALVLESLDISPLHYGLNLDSRLQQSYRLTCAPLDIQWYYQGRDWPVGSTPEVVFWVGYPNGSYDPGDQFPPPPPRTRFDYNSIYHGGTHPSQKLDNFTVYQLSIYPNNRGNQTGYVTENFYPGLYRSNGDMFVVMFKHGQRGRPIFVPRTPNYLAVIEKRIDSNPDGILKDPVGPSAYALGCFEQYQLCFANKCTKWTGAQGAVKDMSLLLQEYNDSKHASDLINAYNLLVNVITVRNFLSNPLTTSILVRTMDRSTSSQYFSRAPPQKQWHKEVVGWFQASFLLAKINLFTSTQGIKTTSRNTRKHYSALNNTDWMCNKLVFPDSDSSNINFIGLISTLAGCLVICFISVLGSFVTSAKRAGKAGWSIYRRIQKAIYRNLLSLYHWIQATGFFPGTDSIIIQFKAVFNRHSPRQRTARSDYTDDLWTNIAFGLDEFDDS